MFDPVIAPSGTLLGLLQRGRGDGTLHALAEQRGEALAALEQCVLSDPRRDWQVESRSLYYARLYSELEGGLDGIEQHLFHADDLLDDDEQRTGLALSVLGHLAGYGRRDALRLLRDYAAKGANWAWALDELALRDDDEGLRSLAPAVLARFPCTPEGDAALARALREAYERRPWRLWAEDPVHGDRVRAAEERHAFDRWQRQLRPAGPAPGWSVHDVLDWAQQGLDAYPAQHRDAPAARCLAAVAGPEHRQELLAAAKGGPEAARAAALRFLADRQDGQVLDLIEAAAYGSPVVSRAALESLARMRGAAALERARAWAAREDALGAAAARVLAVRGEAGDAGRVLAALRRLVRASGADAEGLAVLVEGIGRLGIGCAAPVLRHIYRETSSSHVRGCAARALAVTDPSFAEGFAIECLWDCEEATRELAARRAATGDVRVLAQLRRLAADPAEEAEVQTAVRGRLGARPTR
ncbi:HEAT repeat domain-containing protein [Streptomyces sp. RB6PN25]|uniref:HEAT repeat domain-containing protein n=1 Tax=Streptomyces humicola TaxID=2953240 RepID=A0ABT1Q465_9ACTN|nr:HEAT repeat domain-containing protein [Streptomyces humicola]MCQ4083570.1 HEAT repeat domain-containing protein [Streptomyces humicola]